MQIRANEIKLVSLDEIKLNPRNRNKHSKEQITRLAEIITYQGFRNPLIISNRSGLCVAFLCPLARGAVLFRFQF